MGEPPRETLEPPALSPTKAPWVGFGGEKEEGGSLCTLAGVLLLLLLLLANVKEADAEAGDFAGDVDAAEEAIKGGDDGLVMCRPVAAAAMGDATGNAAAAAAAEAVTAPLLLARESMGTLPPPLLLRPRVMPPGEEAAAVSMGAAACLLRAKVIFAGRKDTPSPSLPAPAKREGALPSLAAPRSDLESSPPSGLPEEERSAPPTAPPALLLLLLLLLLLPLRGLVTKPGPVRAVLPPPLLPPLETLLLLPLPLPPVVETSRSEPSPEPPSCFRFIDTAGVGEATGRGEPALPPPLPLPTPAPAPAPPAGAEAANRLRLRDFLGMLTLLKFTVTSSYSCGGTVGGSRRPLLRRGGGSLGRGCLLGVRVGEVGPRGGVEVEEGRVDKRCCCC